MAQPRVFLSSPTIGFEEIRNSVGAFIRQYGFEAIMCEAAQIPYGLTDSFEEDCKEEIQCCDILVSIVGKRFGSPSKNHPHSISQMEVYWALESNSRVLLFVEQHVHAEFFTFLANHKDRNLHFSHADDPRIYEFLEDMYQRGVTIFSYTNATDIENVLRKQWAGWFHRWLRADSRSRSLHAKPPMTSRPAEEMKIEQTDCPAFLRLQDLLDSEEPIHFSSLEELAEQLLVYGFEQSAVLPSDPSFEWEKYDSGVQIVLLVSKQLFDQEGQHLPIDAEKWKDRFIVLKHWENEQRM